MIRNTCLFMLLCILALPAFSQRGLPPKEKTSTVSNTKFPMHLDFLPDMVMLLKVPEGWEVK